MTERSLQSDEMRRYVLGSLSEAEQEAFELNYFGDPALLEEVQHLRDEVLDEFLSGALEPAEHELLSARLARSAVWRDKAAVLQTLRNIARDSPPPTSTLDVPAADVDAKTSTSLVFRLWGFRRDGFGLTAPVRWAALAAGLVLLGWGVWLVSSGYQESAPTITLNVTPTPHEPGSSATPVVAATPKLAVTPAAANSKSQIATFSLALNLTRQIEEAAVLNLKAGTSQIELQLDLRAAADDAVAASYQVSLHNAVGQRIWQNPRAAVRRMQGRRVLLLNLPAQLVTAGHYELRLRADQSLEAEATTLPFTVQMH